MSDIDPQAQADIEAAIAAAGGGGGSVGSPPKPLGVPAPFTDPDTGETFEWAQNVERDWGTETRTPGGGLTYQQRRYNQVVPPRYMDGDQFDIYSMTPQRISYLQRSLVQAGLLDPQELQSYGFVGPAGDDPTFAAYEQAMMFANQAGYTTVDQALVALQSGRYGTGPGGRRTPQGGGGGGRLPAQISNADDLRRVFKATVIDTLGQGWDEDRIDSMVAAYQAIERGQVEAAEQMALRAGEASAASGQFVSSGTLEAPPSPETFAAQFARGQDPTGAQANDFLGAANQFLGLLGQWNPPAGDLPDGAS